MATVTSELSPLERHLADDPERLYEVIDGQTVAIPHMGAWETWIASILSVELNNWARPRRAGSSIVEGLFLIDPDKGLRRRPDVAFVSADRWAFHRTIPREEIAWAVVPDLAVEVISRTNLADEVVDKIADYFLAGVRLVWIIYPSQRLVYVYDTPRSVRILGVGEVLEGDDRLPDFRLSIASMFGNDARAVSGE